ncbi:shikimate kinase [Limihaloglobus sulfuriphilus]|nr:shikimate kinase [Limihaloglobus sulfuriphilus]
MQKSKHNITERPIALIGFMGVGKTAVGTELAKLTDRELVDLDSIIEDRSGTDIPSVFREHGEDYFRRLESSLMEDYLTSGRGVILSCGGGIVISERNRQLLAKHAEVVWLEQDIDVCLERVQSGSRPLLDREDSSDFARELYEKRKPLYKQAADVVINRSDKDIETTAREIYDMLKNS